MIGVMMKKIFMFVFLAFALVSCGDDNKYAKDFANALKQGDAAKIIKLLPEDYANGVKFGKDEFLAHFNAFAKNFIKDVQVSPDENNTYDLKVVLTNEDEKLYKIAFVNSKLNPTSFEILMSGINQIISKSYITNATNLANLNAEISKYYTINADMPQSWSDVTGLAKGDVVSFGFSKPCIELRLNQDKSKVDVNIINQDDAYCKNFINSNADTIKSFEKGYGGSSVIFNF